MALATRFNVGPCCGCEQITGQVKFLTRAGRVMPYGRVDVYRSNGTFIGTGYADSAGIANVPLAGATFHNNVRFVVSNVPRCATYATPFALRIDTTTAVTVQIWSVAEVVGTKTVHLAPDAGFGTSPGWDYPQVSPLTITDPAVGAVAVTWSGNAWGSAVMTVGGRDVIWSFASGTPGFTYSTGNLTSQSRAAGAGAYLQRAVIPTTGTVWFPTGGVLHQTGSGAVSRAPTPAGPPPGGGAAYPWSVDE